MITFICLVVSLACASDLMDIETDLFGEFIGATPIIILILIIAAILQLLGIIPVI